MGGLYLRIKHLSSSDDSEKHLSMVRLTAEELSQAVGSDRPNKNEGEGRDLYDLYICVFIF